MGITERVWCDFIVYTTIGLSVEHIHFDCEYWEKELLPKQHLLVFPEIMEGFL